MDGPEYAELPSHVKNYLRRGKGAFISHGAADLDKIRTHVLESLGALLYVERFYKDGDKNLGSAKSRLFYSAVELLVSPKLELSNKDCYWDGAHTQLLGSILTKSGGQNSSLLNDGDWRPLHWAGLLGDKCSVADFHEIAADHGEDLAGSNADVESPAHYAAAAAQPNLAVLEAMAMINLRVFNQKDRRPGRRARPAGGTAQR